MWFFNSDLKEIIKFVKAAPIDKEMSKKQKKQERGKKKRKQATDLQTLMNIFMNEC